MRGVRARWWFAIALLLAPASACAQQPVRPTAHPFLYRIEGNPPSFLYGTIHVPDDRVLALPRSVRLALQRADVLVTELVFDARTEQVLLAGLTLPGGKTVADVLPAPVLARLERYLQRKGLALEVVERFKLVALGAQLEVLDYLSSRRLPLDRRLMELASQAGKPVEALETPEEQIAALDVLSPAEQVQVFDEELARLEKLEPNEPGPVEKMVVAYVAGDETALWAESMAYVDPADPVDARFVEALFTRRNERFAERIEKRLAARPPRAQLIALGALHLFGPDGVVARLEKRGRTLVRLEGNATP
jgi:uncharacterized protein YbaP (TraB family)